MEAKRGDVRLLTIVVLACFTLIWVLVRERATLDMQRRSPTGVPYTTIEHEVVESESFLPQGAAMLSELRADVDEDGMEEIVIAFNDEDQPFAGDGGGVLVLDTRDDHQYKAWQTRPLSKGEVTDLVLEDINQDGGLEILLYKATEDETWYYVHIYDWDGSGYVAITPRGGPLDGMEALVSAYYPPDFTDVDMDGSKELLAYEEQPAYERLEVLVYAWDGETLVYDNLYIVLGPPRPHPVEGQRDSSK